jgi:hypothetical protein
MPILGRDVTTAESDLAKSPKRTQVAPFAAEDIPQGSAARQIANVTYMKAHWSQPWTLHSSGILRTKGISLSTMCQIGFNNSWSAQFLTAGGYCPRIAKSASL